MKQITRTTTALNGASKELLAALKNYKVSCAEVRKTLGGRGKLYIRMDEILPEVKLTVQ